MNKPRALLALVFLAHAPALLPAAVQTQTFDLAQTIFDGPVAAPGAFTIDPISILVQPFDTGLGTLDSVDLTWDVTMTGTATNTAEASGSFNFSFGAQLRVAGVIYNGFGNGSGGGGPAGATYSHSTEATNSDTLLPTETDPDRIAIWSTLSGPAAFNLSAADSGGHFGDYTFFTALANATIAIAPGSELTVTFNYTPVPEPSSAAALLGFSAVGAVATRRRRRSD